MLEFQKKKSTRLLQMLEFRMHCLLIIVWSYVKRNVRRSKGLQVALDALCCGCVCWLRMQQCVCVCVCVCVWKKVLQRMKRIFLDEGIAERICTAQCPLHSAMPAALAHTSAHTQTHNHRTHTGGGPQGAGKPVSLSSRSAQQLFHPVGQYHEESRKDKKTTQRC